MARKLHDEYFKRAKKEGYFARSVYKLKELDERCGVFAPGMAVLDLGCAPGSWIQYIREAVGPAGVVAGVDLQPVKPSIRKKAFIVRKDITEVEEADLAPAARRFDAVVSDMAPKTTGVKAADQAASMELCRIALDLALRMLSRRGNFVCKVFESPKTRELADTARAHFGDVSFCKPKACRDESIETFLVAKGFGRDAAEMRAEKKAAKGRRTPGRRSSKPRKGKRR